MTQPTEKEIQRQLRKEQRRQEQIPKARSYFVRLDDLELPVKAKWTQDSVAFTTTLPTSGKEVTATFKFGTEMIERRVHVLYGETYVGTLLPQHRTYLRGGNGKLARDKMGKTITVKVAMPATFLTITATGFKMTSVSVCKEPDPWDQREGIKYCLRHLFNGGERSSQREERKDKLTKLFRDRSDYQALLKVCLARPPKMSQVRRYERLRKAAITPID